MAWSERVDKSARAGNPSNVRICQKIPNFLSTAWNCEFDAKRKYNNAQNNVSIYIQIRERLASRWLTLKHIMHGSYRLARNPVWTEYCFLSYFSRVLAFCESKRCAASVSIAWNGIAGYSQDFSSCWGCWRWIFDAVGSWHRRPKYRIISDRAAAKVEGLRRGDGRARRMPQSWHRFKGPTNEISRGSADPVKLSVGCWPSSGRFSLRVDNSHAPRFNNWFWHSVSFYSLLCVIGGSVNLLWLSWLSWCVFLYTLNLLLLLQPYSLRIDCSFTPKPEISRTLW